MPVEGKRMTTREVRHPRERGRIPQRAFVPDAGRRVITPGRLRVWEIPTREAMPAVLVAPANRILERRQLAPGVLDGMARDALRRVALRAVTDAPAVLVLPDPEERVIGLRPREEPRNPLLDERPRNRREGEIGITDVGPD